MFFMRIFQNFKNNNFSEHLQVTATCKYLEPFRTNLAHYRNTHFVSVRIRSFSGPYFPAFGMNTDAIRIWENADQKNSKYGHFLRSDRYEVG